MYFHKINIHINVNNYQGITIYVVKRIRPENTFYARRPPLVNEYK